MKIQGMILIVSMCGFLLFIMAVKAKSQILLNGLFRGLCASAAIILINYILQMKGEELQIGLNPITFLTCTILGFPGFILVLGLHLILLL